MTPAALVGRSAELRRLTELIDGVSGGGGCLVVSGDPGIGKSALLGEAAQLAADRGMRVLRARGSQPEVRLPFAGLHQLLQPVLGEVHRLLPAQQEAVRGAFGVAPVSGPAPFRVALAALELLTECAADVPILLLVEDGQLIDPSSAEALAFIGRRLGFDPIVLLVAHRDGTASPLDGRYLPLLRLDGLGEASAAQLLDWHAPALDSGTRGRILALAAGNPLALLELPKRAGRMAEAMLLARAIPLTERLERAFADRADSLPSTTQTLLLAAAANDGETLAEALAAAGLALGTVVTLGDLQPAISAGLVAVDDLAMRFRHPLVCSALWQAASLPRRHAVLTALAAGMSGQPDRQVWHLAAAAVGPDPALADELEAAATRAEERGALTTALTALERAAQLTEDPNRKAERLLRSISDAVRLARMDIAARLLADMRQLPLHGLVAAQAAFTDGVLTNAAWSGTAELARLVRLAAEIAERGGANQALDALWLVAPRMWWTVISQEARDLVVATAEQLSLPDDSMALAEILAQAAPVQRGAVVRERIIRLGVPAEATDEELTKLAIAATALGAFSPAAELLDAAVARLRAGGRLFELAHALVSQALTWLLTGELASASVAADEAVRMGEETGQPQWAAAAQALAAIAIALRGDPDTAAGLADRAGSFFSAIRAGTLMALVCWAQGTAALVAGRPAEAWERLSVIFDPAEWTYHPFLRFWVVPDLAEAASRTGQGTAAAAWIAELEPLAERGRDPLLLAGLSYARAVLAEGDDAEPLFRAALGPETETWPLLHARVLLAYGTWLRRHRRVTQSRAPLRAARAAFEARGATAWADMAQRELRATGETPRRRGPAAWDRLTPQELQIAQLAAQGATNAEIGQRLYVSHRTVSTHLHHIFPKLGITSRTQLAAALATGLAHDGPSADS
jgi:DNA-binding CsgD family transcriptional regulator